MLPSTVELATLLATPKARYTHNPLNHKRFPMGGGTPKAQPPTPRCHTEGACLHFRIEELLLAVVLVVVVPMVVVVFLAVVVVLVVRGSLSRAYSRHHGLWWWTGGGSGGGGRDGGGRRRGAAAPAGPTAVARKKIKHIFLDVPPLMKQNKEMASGCPQNDSNAVPHFGRPKRAKNETRDAEKTYKKQQKTYKQKQKNVTTIEKCMKSM